MGSKGSKKKADPTKLTEVSLCYMISIYINGYIFENQNFYTLMFKIKYFLIKLMPNFFSNSSQIGKQAIMIF